MKKISFLLSILILIILIIIFIPSDSKKISTKKVIEEVEDTELRALFVSYMELNTYIQDKDISTAKKNIKKIVKNTKDNYFNTIILQVRSYDDSIYDSNEFRICKSIILNDESYFDVLDYFIKECDKNNIDLYVWINPYRITRPNEDLENDNFAYQYRDTDVVKEINNMYFYNPARSEAEEHILRGIKELVDNYNFKGLLFDDYFYPSDDIDNLEYLEYSKDNDITLGEYHIKVINNFIEKVHKIVKESNKNIMFGISPDGNIDNNYNKHYADVYSWCSESKYIDFIMPQIYYGFYNSAKPFKETINEWSNIIKNKDINLYFALALYKVGNIDLYAKEGELEWIENKDIIKRQILLSRNISNYKGFSLFRYDNLFNEEIFTDNSKEEIDNLKSTLKK